MEPLSWSASRQRPTRPGVLLAQIAGLVSAPLQRRRARYCPAMTSDMTMNRVIHAAVRRDLARLESGLAAAHDGDTGRARQLETAFANLHRELTHHHRSEDDLVFPYVAQVDGVPALIEEMEDEHHAMAEALAETHAAMTAYASTGSAADAESARASVVRTQAVVDRHLTHEETEFEPLLRPHMETPEWKAIEKQLRPKSLGDTGSFMAWIQDGMTEESRTYLHSTIPRPVTFLLSKVAGRSYNRDVAPTWQA
jgi:iron-sulfur cluster repair protein YtfE (RIC family)